MSTPSGHVFTINGTNFDSSQLSPEGQQLLALLTESQNELVRLETRKALLQAAQQQLITQLKPLLPVSEVSQPNTGLGVLGTASTEIPTTPVEKPNSEPAVFPDSISDEIRAKP